MLLGLCLFLGYYQRHSWPYNPVHTYILNCLYTCMFPCVRINDDDELLCATNSSVNRCIDVVCIGVIWFAVCRSTSCCIHTVVPDVRRSAATVPVISPVTTRHIEVCLAVRGQTSHAALCSKRPARTRNRSSMTVSRLFFTNLMNHTVSYPGNGTQLWIFAN